MGSTELIKAEKFGLVALDPNSDVSEILEEALAGAKVGLGDLERVKWPSGGATVFERNVLGATSHEGSIEGVIVYQRMSRAYWADPKVQEGAQPDCTSPDGEWGYGQPGDQLREQNPPKGCEVCPMAQFGSALAEDGVTRKRGQACALRRDLFILTPGAAFPLIVSVPPASLGPAQKFLVDLASHGIRYYNVVVKLGLTKQTNKDGQPYAEASLALSGRLDDSSVEGVAQYRERMVPSFKATPAVVVDVVPGTAEDED